VTGFVPNMTGGVARCGPVLDASVRGLCPRPYPGHPKGCPNFGKKRRCPPRAKLLPDVLDMREPVYAAWNAFPLGAWAEHLRERHPDWSERQLRCCFYWQGTARKGLRDEVDGFLVGRSLVAVYTPEACGVDVTKTMAQVGVTLEWPPSAVAYQVALLGSRKKRVR